MYDKLIPKITMISISLHLDGTLLLMTMVLHYLREYIDKVGIEIIWMAIAVGHL